jgi:hypothetical protein
VPRCEPAAGVALGRIGDEEAVGSLQAASWDSDGRVQGAVGRPFAAIEGRKRRH